MKSGNPDPIFPARVKTAHGAGPGLKGMNTTPGTRTVPVGFAHAHYREVCEVARLSKEESTDFICH